MRCTDAWWNADTGGLKPRCSSSVRVQHAPRPKYPRVVKLADTPVSEAGASACEFNSRLADQHSTRGGMAETPD